MNTIQMDKTDAVLRDANGVELDRRAIPQDACYEVVEASGKLKLTKLFDHPKPLPAAEEVSG